jgi:NADH-quinone oxidoreductase subunit J
LMFIGLGIKAGKEHLPNINFYLFSFLALGSSLRVISHPRPVYAALWFIMTILASAGLYVLLSAEFMAFALIIVYAGAILITYMFVLMLATESPTAEQSEALAEYDRYSREPIVAALAGFLLVAATVTMMTSGAASLPKTTVYKDTARIEQLPKRIETALREAGLMDKDERIARGADGKLMIDLFPRPGSAGEVRPGTVSVAFGKDPGESGVADTATRVISTDNPKWPADLKLGNVEGVGFTLLADHPGAIEIAGVILLMAMLGAVVLARKKVELDEAAKLSAQQRSLADEFSPQNSPLMAPAVPGAPNVREAATRSLGEAPGRTGGAQ